MNKRQRIRVRESLTERGFERTASTEDTSGVGDDHTGVGDYTETWTHPDGSTVKLKWSPRRSNTHLLIETGRAGSLAACDEFFANGEPGSPDITEVDCGQCLALFPHRPR